MIKPILIATLFIILFIGNNTTFANAIKSGAMQVDDRQTNQTFPIDSILLGSYSNEDLISFYKLNNFQTVWNSAKNRNTVVSKLSNAEEDGLNPEDYKAKWLTENEDRFSTLSENEIISHDIALTLNFQKYISHMNRGKLNPNELYDDWDLDRSEIISNSAISNAIKQDSLFFIIDKITPKHSIYKKLKQALLLINSYKKDSLQIIDSSEKLIPNDRKPIVIDVKKKLMYWNDLKSKKNISMHYDEETVVAVKKFQKRHGLIADGIIGKTTITALNYSKEDRKKQIIANLERWRWFSKKMGKQHILINIPEYKLYMVYENDTTRIHAIIVGTAKRKTPILNSKLSHVVLNPTWTIPPTILKEDIIPETIKNRNYLAKKNTKIYDYNGKTINAWKWDPNKAFNYKYVQSPGNHNSLGRVKISFPNDHAVYLHDTNHKELFKKHDRSLSSGCIRVQDPLALTAYLLNDEKWQLEKITEILKSDKTQNVPIKDTIEIHQLYWTAWSDKNSLQFRPDIYDLDLELYCYLRN